MTELKQDVVQIQELVSSAFQRTGEIAALADSGQPVPAKLQRALEQTMERFEQAALELRRLCEKNSPGVGGYGNRPAAPRMEAGGYVERFGYGWLHIQLNTLLPHCRYQTPEWLSDTIRRLLDEYESGGSELPRFNRAMLLMDAHCGFDGRHFFDQDKKGWKAVSNALKGRLIPDDDQHTLSLALLSRKSELNVCHIALLDQADAADFFSMHFGDYARNDFYGGTWSC